MLKIYKYSDEAVYIPLVLNMMVIKKDFSAKNNMYVSKDFLKYLNDKICSEVVADIIILPEFCT